MTSLAPKNGRGGEEGTINPKRKFEKKIQHNQQLVRESVHLVEKIWSIHGTDKLDAF